MKGPDEEPPAPIFVGAKRHYVQGVGYFLNKGPEYTRLAGAPPKTQVATIIVVWPTDSKGNINKDQVLQTNPQVIPWIFSRDKYDAIKTQHNQFPLGSYDLMATCVDSQFQKMTFVPARQQLLAMLMETGKGDDVVKFIVDRVRELKATIQDELASDLTLDQIREKMNGEGGPGPVAAAPAAAGEIDDILGGILGD